jgi:hypothetical protein
MTVLPDSSINSAVNGTGSRMAVEASKRPTAEVERGTCTAGKPVGTTRNVYDPPPRGA